MTEEPEKTSRVGTKGEIYLPKKVRDRLGWKQSTPVVLRIHGNDVIISRKTRFVDLISRDAIRRTLSEEQSHQLDKEINEEIEQ